MVYHQLAGVQQHAALMRRPAAGAAALRAPLSAAGVPQIRVHHVTLPRTAAPQWDLKIECC
jgi:hypothetical protein